MILSDDEEETSLRNVINGSVDILSSRQRGLPSNRGDSINDTQISFLTRDGKLSEAKNAGQLQKHNATLSQVNPTNTE